MPTDTPSWLSKLAGRFIVFDGPDGSGKSTQFHRFAQILQSSGLEVCLLREPGGTAIGEKIRSILLDPSHSEMDVHCEMLLYMASRAQVVSQIIRPALSRGQVVLADRFISSTLAYQGTAGGMPTVDILRVGQIAVGSSWPDWVVIFDVDEETAAKRLAANPKTKSRKYVKVEQPTLFSDRLELKGIEYQRAVRRGYLDQARSDPKRYILLDASMSSDAVFDSLLIKFAEKLSG